MAFYEYLLGDKKQEANAEGDVQGQDDGGDDEKDEPCYRHHHNFPKHWQTSQSSKVPTTSSTYVLIGRGWGVGWPNRTYLEEAST